MHFVFEKELEDSSKNSLKSSLRLQQQLQTVEAVIRRNLLRPVHISESISGKRLLSPRSICGCFIVGARLVE